MSTEPILKGKTELEASDSIWERYKILFEIPDYSFAERHKEDVESMSIEIDDKNNIISFTNFVGHSNIEFEEFDRIIHIINDIGENLWYYRLDKTGKKYIFIKKFNNIKFKNGTFIVKDELDPDNSSIISFTYRTFTYEFTYDSVDLDESKLEKEINNHVINRYIHNI